MDNITNKVLLEALSDINNIRIMNKVCSKYRNTIPYDELERCKLVSLWQALLAYDPEGGRKFTSFLYNRIDWECKKQIYQINRIKSKHIFCEEVSKEDSHCYQDSFEIQEVLNKLDPKYQRAVSQRFFKKMTMQEIADSNGYSRETARRYVKKGLDEVRKCLSN